jgi:phosphoribosylpyrophosphate synthetase
MTTTFAPYIGYPVHRSMDEIDDITNVNIENIIKHNTENLPISLIFKGSSGAILSTAIYLGLKDRTAERIKLYQVRPKSIGDGPFSHHDNDGLSPNMGKYDKVERFNVIVDDFISTGETLKNILHYVEPKYVDLILIRNVQWFVEGSDEFTRLKMCYESND